MQGNVNSRNIEQPDQTQDHSNCGFGAVTCGNGTTIDLTPLDGIWTQAQYLRLTDHSRLLLEFTDGRIEILTMPTDRHQAILQFLFVALLPFMGAHRRRGAIRSLAPAHP